MQPDATWNWEILVLLITYLLNSLTNVQFSVPEYSVWYHCMYTTPSHGREDVEVGLLVSTTLWTYM
jgi:hypothetical protein